MRTEITNRKIIKKIIILILLYIAGLAAAFFLIFMIQHHTHADMGRLAQSVAAEIAQKGVTSTKVQAEAVVSANTGTANTDVFFFEKESVRPVVLYESPNKDMHPYHIFKSPRSLFYINLDLTPLTFTATSVKPVFVAEGWIGSVYITRIIHYLPSVVGAFTIFYSILYIIVLLYFRLQRKTNDRIKNIYDKYIANISHELKTPIASIQAITSTLCEGLVEDDATQKRYYSIIDRESKRLEQSVLDIIALSKLQDHQVDVHKCHTSISDILPSIRDRYEGFCECVGIHFYIEDSTWELDNLYTNPDRIIQLMQIIVDNAIKFSAEGDTISISATWNDKQATICIADTGCGMDEETINHLFDRFYRGKNALEKEGSGLGLAIAKELTNALNEKIRAESILGVGTKFFFTISRKK